MCTCQQISVQSSQISTWAPITSATKREQGPATEWVTSFLTELNYCASGTWFSKAGPSYYSADSEGDKGKTTPDQFLIPSEKRQMVKDVLIYWQMGRRVQLIPSGLPTDHLPVKMWLTYQLDFPVVDR